MWNRWLILLLLIPTLASGATLSCPFGKFATAQAATGGSANIGQLGKAPAAAFQYTTTAGTATVQLEICCTKSCDASTGDWALVSGSSKSLNAAATKTDGFGLSDPACLYRTNVTACAGCFVTTVYECTGP